MDNPYSQDSGLIDRVKAIITQPAETWPAVAAEETTPGDLLTRYALPLIVLGPIAGLIGGQVFGYGAFGFHYRPGLTFALTTAVLGIVMAVVLVFVIGFVADFLADKFDGTPNRTAAMKLVVYSLTPSWVAGILGIYPPLVMLGILASLYGLYLFYQGSTPLMKVPEAKAVGYTAVTTIAAIVLMWVATAVTTSLTGMFGMSAMSSMAAADGGSAEMTIPGVGKIDTGKIEQATNQMQAAASGKASDPAALAALLPASLGGYNRTALDSGALGGAGAQADGTYTMGDKTIHLKIMDSPSVGAIAGLGAAFGAQENHEDANGYERTTSDGGQMRVEKWNHSENRGEFSQQIASRFIVSAEGEAGSIDELKAAVATITPDRLAALAK